MTYVSEWCRDRIAPALSAKAAGRMQRLSPGVDTERFFPGCGGEEIRRRFGIPQNAPVVVCVARMVKRKGQDTLLAAWPAVLQSIPDARLLLVGDGPIKGAVEKQVRRFHLEPSVILTGGIPWDQIPAHMDAGDIFAMPCRTRRFGLEAEAFGIVFLEAQACGLPVVIGRSGGSHETLTPGCGELVDGHSTKEVARAVQNVWRSHGTHRLTQPEAATSNWTASARILSQIFATIRR
jgi:phosphatidyl-myo-inositol dimannoside synthase